MYSKNPQDGVGTSPGATNSWKKKKEEDIFRLNCEYYYPALDHLVNARKYYLFLFYLFTYFSCYYFLFIKLQCLSKL